ncbi:heterokaryon incompatibility protein-domain-containing protein [Cladorrhinum samala]|uniref:Heterokaryon incompatibility protein-domain-containing protein n=1 Tax=Cladorrhinum samala TaxID=585594 RepID=A0AAV9HZZ4_9PEZI|nr:heterokaryon incompatibility protein-domain-containing protein [Cladorrhinum samala]
MIKIKLRMSHAQGRREQQCGRTWRTAGAQSSLQIKIITIMVTSSIYRPIDSQNGQVRLLVLGEIESDQETPHYHFTYVHLRDNPAFEALSYVWGDPTPTYRLVVDGAPTTVPTNLGIVLPYLTGRLMDLPIWIDALCINQKDENEKGAQIALMGQIFSMAANVLSWLGERPRADEDLAWHQFEKLVLRQKSLKHPPLFRRTNSRSAWGKAAKQPIHLNGQAMVKGHAVDAFGSILRRRYFTRLWVVQEVVLAKHALGMVGNIVFDLEHVLGVAGRSMGEEAVDVASALRLIRSAHARGEALSMMELLNITHKYQVTDRRDRIVALLGIARDSDRIHFNAGALYHLEPQDFLQMFTRAYIESLQVYNGGVAEWNQVLSVMKRYTVGDRGSGVYHPIDVRETQMALTLMSAIEVSISQADRKAHEYQFERVKPKFDEYTDLMLREQRQRDDERLHAVFKREEEPRENMAAVLNTPSETQDKRDAEGWCYQPI